MFAFQKGGDCVGGKSPAHILDHKTHHPVKQILPGDTVSFHDVAGYDSMINALHDLIRCLIVVIAQRHQRESACADVIRKQF